MRLLLLTAAWLMVTTTVANGAKIQVQLQQGVIEGWKMEGENGRSFYGFRNIPFAEPPVGNLRFKDPVAAGPWTGVRNGSIPTVACPQYKDLDFSKEREAIGNEDCLYLTVYTPRPYESDLPVMVYIHGGAYYAGSSDAHSPLPILNKDVVLVVIQYRLGLLGFMSTEDSSMPGNMGLKDQTMALRWVKDNIEDLGGDPDQVTIFGESAGGSSVHFHILSPMSKGLFHRAIIQSGTALCPWALREDHRKVATEISKKFNCSENEASLESSTLVSCLKDVSAEELLDALQSLTVFAFNPLLAVPNVDGEFLPDHPAILLREGRYNKVDIMMGVTQDEGGMFLNLMKSSPELANSLIENFTDNGPFALVFDDAEDDPEYLARRAVYHYIKGPVEMLEEDTAAATQLFSDRMFKVCHCDAAHFHAQDFGQHVFLYELQHLAESEVFEALLAENVTREHIMHGEDLLYLFDPFMNGSLSRNDDLFLQRIMVDLWTNFAIKGHPTPDLSLGFLWKPTTSKAKSYLSLTPSPEMKEYHHEKTLEFWRNMPLKTNKLLFPERFAMTPKVLFNQGPKRNGDFDFTFFYLL